MRSSHRSSRSTRATLAAAFSVALVHLAPTPCAQPCVQKGSGTAVQGRGAGAERVEPASAPGSPGTAFVEVGQELGLVYTQANLLNPGPSSNLYLTGGAAAGDVDGDGWVDVYAALYSDGDVLFRNLGADRDGEHRGFADVTRDAFEFSPGLGASNGTLFFDLENDGDLDLYVTSHLSSRYELWVNDGTGFFTEEAIDRGAAIETPNQHTGSSIAAGDYDRDGFLDLYVAEWGNAFVVPGVVESHSRLLRNLGDGSFEDTTLAAQVSIDHLLGMGPVGSFGGVFAFSPSFSDVDGDGHPDLLLASDFSTSRLFWNQGDGTFLDGTIDAGVGTDENGMGSAIGDFDGDGDLDWFVSSIWDPDDLCRGGTCNWSASGNRLYAYDAKRAFLDVTDDAGVRDGGWGWGSSFFDYDNDGDLDLMHTNGIDFPFTSLDDVYATDATRFFENDGSGSFSEKATELGVTDTGSGKALFTFDYDRDGDLDVMIVQNGDRPLVYRNEIGNRNDWLRVELRGTSSNSFGIGARVWVVPAPGARPILRELRCGSNYLSQDEMALSFGLRRNADRVERVIVEWPSGKRTLLEGVTRNQSIVIEEGGAPTSARPEARSKAVRTTGVRTTGVRSED